MPENEIPPAMRVDFYYVQLYCSGFEECVVEADDIEDFADFIVGVDDADGAAAIFKIAVDGEQHADARGCDVVEIFKIKHELLAVYAAESLFKIFGGDGVDFTCEIDCESAAVLFFADLQFADAHVIHLLLGFAVFYHKNGYIVKLFFPGAEGVYRIENA